MRNTLLVMIKMRQRLLQTGSTWLTENRTTCWRPPSSVAIDRAGRMAAVHTPPDPTTWQNMKIIFVASYRTFARARKNLKFLQQGQEH
ncbi:LOW QUALITY PROTEIN: E3 ubiquitin-protein ligase SspH2, partial [Frankliniella fusca]